MQIFHAHDAARQLPLPPNAKWPAGVPFVTVFQHGSMLTELCQLRGQDHQTPHEQDELYFILEGSAVFVHADGEQPVQRGHAILVPAGKAHHFKDMSADFAAWVVFWGPPGGE